MTAFSKLFDIVPGWVWALACVAALAFGWVQYDAKRGLQVELAEVDTQLANQKIEAGKLLATETEKVNVAEGKLKDALLAQELKDAKNKKESAAAAKALADAIATGGGRLRDPAAKRCGNSGSAPQATGNAAANNRAADPAEADGFISESLTRLLLGEAETNDNINDAYASCRADSIKLRSTIDEFNAGSGP